VSRARFVFTLTSSFQHPGNLHSYYNLTVVLDQSCYFWTIEGHCSYHLHKRLIVARVKRMTLPITTCSQFSTWATTHSFNKKLLPTSLSDLPTELIAAIYKHAPTLPTASALSQTSATNHAIWTANIPDICDAVLRQVIQCHEQAIELFEAQETVSPIELALRLRLEVASKTNRRNLPEMKYLMRAPKATSMVIEKVRRLLSNAYLMERTLDSFRTSAVVHGPRKLTEKMCDRFVKSYYRATALATLVEEPGFMARLAHLNRLETFQLCDVMAFLRVRENPRPMLKIVDPSADGEFHPLWLRSILNWFRADEKLGLVYERLLGLPLNRRIKERRGRRPRLRCICDDAWEQGNDGNELPLAELVTLNDDD